MRFKEFLPFVPDEEKPINQQLHRLLHDELLPLRRSSSLPYTLDTLEGPQKKCTSDEVPYLVAYLLATLSLICVPRVLLLLTTTLIPYDSHTHPPYLTYTFVPPTVYSLCRELLAIRKEFKRLVEEEEEDDNCMEKTEEDDDDDDAAAGLYKSTSISFLSIVLTPTDTLINQIEITLVDLLEPLLCKLSPLLYPVYTRVKEWYKQLVAMRMTGAYSVETDILPIQRQLVDVENQYVRDGKWLLPDGPVDQPILAGQSVLFAALHDCHRVAHYLVSQLDQISESLVPVHERLVTLHKQLRQMAKAESSSYSIKQVAAIQRELHAIDSLRHTHHDEAPG